MEIQELIQLIRTCNLAQAIAQLEKLKKHSPAKFAIVADFYVAAAKRKK